MDTVVQHEFVKADSVNPNPVASGLYFYLDPEVFVSDPTQMKELIVIIFPIPDAGTSLSLV